MYKKLENSWNLAKESWRILMMDKEMLMFPILSTLTSTVVFGGLACLVWMSGLIGTSGLIHLNLATFSMMVIIVFIPAYINYVIMNFYNAGLTTCALIRLCGDDPVLADGLRIAWKRLPQILTWSLITAAVNIIVRSIKKRGSFLRNAIGSSVDYVWKVASFFSIAAIVAEEAGPKDALQRSISLVKKNWGEAATLQAGISVLSVPSTAPAIFVLGFAVQVTSPSLKIGLIAIAISYSLIATTILSTLEAITKSALYMYAVGEELPQNFDLSILKTSFDGVGSEEAVWA